jgi:hypothetical protein
MRQQTARVDLAPIALTCGLGSIPVDPIIDDQLWIVRKKSDPDHSHSMVAGGLLEMS